AGQHHTKHTQSQQGIFAGAAVPVISDQRQQEEWQIADKHNLHGGMEYDRPRHDHDERSKKAFFLPKIFPEKPQITKQAVCDPCRKHHTLHINCHIHERKQIRKKIQWIIESIVSKIVDILPSSDLHGKIREKISRFIKALPEIFRKYNMLGQPVCLRTRQISSAYLHQKKQYR